MCKGACLGRRFCDTRACAISTVISVARSAPTAFNDQCACKSNASWESASLGNSVLMLPLCITRTPIRESDDLADLRGNHQNRGPLFHKLADNFEHLGFSGDIDPARRLVQDQNP
jgi:hypothetical protein